MNKIARTLVIVAALGGLYLLAQYFHAGREAARQGVVELTPNCKAKLASHGLAAGEVYRSPYAAKINGTVTDLRGYREEDVRAIERGCNIVDDLLGQTARRGDAERWNSARYVRGALMSCSHCHQHAGDKADTSGKRQLGSSNLGASWVMADMYDRFMGQLLPYEWRLMQCFINSSNGFKPNIADDVIRDITAYSRFLSAALDLKIGNRYPEQGMDEIAAAATMRRGDDYVRGAHLYRQRCAACHGVQGLGQMVNGRVVYPAVAGPNSFSHDSRMNFAQVNTVMPGFICRNMPPGQEGSLDNQQCRDIAYYLSTLPRPAGDREGPLAAAWHQAMMLIMPPLTRYAETLGGGETESRIATGAVGARR